VKATARPPREGLARLFSPGPELRDASPDGPATLTGHFSVFNQWTEIDSIFEGRFMESIAPGSFTKTIAENRDAMRILLNHGHDALGNQVIAALTDLREDKIGAHYEAELLEGVPALVVSGLRKGQYGSSFRFDVVREDFNAEPKASDHNTEGIPERVIREARVYEFGPVTFPAYSGATAGVRSLTDEFLFERLARAPKFARAVDPVVLGQISLVDALIDQADEAIDTVMDALAIPDPDEGDEPAENAARVKGLVRKARLIKSKAPSSGAAKPAPRTSAAHARPRFQSREEFVEWLSN